MFGNFASADAGFSMLPFVLPAADRLLISCILLMFALLKLLLFGNFASVDAGLEVLLLLIPTVPVMCCTFDGQVVRSSLVIFVLRS